MLNSLIGIIASSGKVAGGDYESIATANGTGSAGTITFSSIPSTYKHLQIRGIGRTTATGGIQTTLRMRVNGYSSTYPFHRLLGNGSSASASSSTTEVYFQDVVSVATNSATSNAMGAFVIDILDYANTNKNKTIRSLSGTDGNGAGEVIFGSGLYMETTAISSITLEANGQNWTSTTSFALYGIKG
jgi:hypothetical protein